MICKNCNYILTGKENFCPNCGTVPEAVASPFPKPRESHSQPAENIIPEIKPPRSLNELIFNENITPSSPSAPELKVYNLDSDEENEETEYDKSSITKAKKSAVGRIFVLLFICCTLAITAFGLADYFGILKSDLIEDKEKEEKNIKNSDAMAGITVKMFEDEDFFLVVKFLSELDKKQFKRAKVSLHNLFEERFDIDVD